MFMVTYYSEHNHPKDAKATAVNTEEKGEGKGGVSITSSNTAKSVLTNSDQMMSANLGGGEGASISSANEYGWFSDLEFRAIESDFDFRSSTMLGEKDSDIVDSSADSEFENLPEGVKRCLIYCSLVPLDYEFEKDELVQLWIAEELIDVKDEKEMEKVLKLCFDTLASRNYLMSSRFDNLYGQQKYKVNESKASQWYFQRDSSQDSYMRIETALDDKSRMALHLSLLCDKLDQTEFEGLKRCKQLRTLLLFRDSGNSIKEIPRDLLLCLKSLRTLGLSRFHISELPTSIGCLESLHYLDLSYSPIKRLPESIDCLHNLQTLKLRGCSALRALPEGMRKLINLRHLDFDIARQLNSMPNPTSRAFSLYKRLPTPKK